LSHRRGSFPLTATPGVRTHRTCSPAPLLPLAAAIIISLLLTACGSAGYAPEPRPIGVGERFTLPAGVKLTITISKPGYISKVTTIQIRKGKAPLRTDQCQQPGAKKLIRCPKR